MFRFSAFILAFALFCSCAFAQNANSGQFPGQVAVYITGNRFGEGVILNRNHVLTVARNVFDLTTGNLMSPNAITVRAGVINISGTTPAALAVTRVFPHPGYNRFTLEHNIAVLRMTLDFVLEPNNPLPFLAAATLRNRIVPDTTICQLVGWNAPANNILLQSVAVPVMNRGMCNGQISNPLIQGRVNEENICIGGTTANPAICNNNPGAGLYYDNQLVGLLSTGRQCNTANSPGIVIQTRFYANWIAQQFLREDRPAPGPVSPPLVQ